MTHPILQPTLREIVRSAEAVATFNAMLPDLADSLAGLDDATFRLLLGEEGEFIPAMRRLATNATAMVLMVEELRKYLARRHAKATGLIGKPTE